MPASPVRLNHAVLFVSDVGRSVDFYTGLLGMEVVERMEGAAFLRLPRGANHHDLGLFEVGARHAPRGAVGLYHLAWQVDTIDELASLRAALSDAGALVGQSDHGASKSLYARDPDGIELEVLWLLPRREWGELAASAQPLDLAAELGRWTGVRTAGQIVPEPAP